MFLRSRKSYHCAWASSWAAGVLAVGAASGQGVIGNLTVLHTVHGDVLSSARVSLGFASSSDVPVLQFKAGFATQELFAPQMIFDSFTLTLRTDEHVARVLATMDASGLAVEPPFGGAASGTAGVAAQVLDPPSLNPVFPRQSAFRFEVPLDPSLAGQPLELYFDLFSNQDGVDSQGWFADVVLVPEPRSAWVGVLAILLAARLRSR